MQLQSAVFSFHPVKIITTGEGGVATTNNIDYAERLYKLRSHGIEKNREKFIRPSDKPWIYEQQMLVIIPDDDIPFYL